MRPYDIPEDLWKQQEDGDDWVDVANLLERRALQVGHPLTLLERDEERIFWATHPDYDPSCRCIWRRRRKVMGVDYAKPGAEQTVFVTLDSGARRNWETGARRDVDTDKPRYDLVSNTALKREAELLGRGAAKYGDRNWQKGMPVSVFVASLLRHIYQFLEGDATEDHLAAVRFNAAGIMEMEEMAEAGVIPLYYLDEGVSMQYAAQIWSKRIMKFSDEMGKHPYDIRVRHGDIFVMYVEGAVVLSGETFDRMSYEDYEAAVKQQLTDKKTGV